MTTEEKNTLQNLLKKYLEEQEGKKPEDAASIVEEAFNGKKTVEEVEEKFSKTENGALAYKTSGKVFVDFIFNLNSFRKADGADRDAAAACIVQNGRGRLRGRYGSRL